MTGNDTPDSKTLSRRERQIMDLVYELGQCSARDIHAGLTDPPSYSSVRALLVRLVDKGHLTHTQLGAKYLYSAAMPLAEARLGAVQRLLKTFFSGSVSQAVNALVDSEADNLSDADLDDLAAMIDKARKKRDLER